MNSALKQRVKIINEVYSLVAQVFQEVAQHLQRLHTDALTLRGQQLVDHPENIRPTAEDHPHRYRC